MAVLLSKKQAEKHEAGLKANISLDFVQENQKYNEFCLKSLLLFFNFKQTWLLISLQSIDMFKAVIAGLIGATAMAFQIEDLTVPHTEIGDATVACNPGSAPKKTNGFSTYFSDDTYACQKWNHKAKSSSECFVAINGVCGMKTGTFCDHCVLITNSNGESEKCRVIDFCDPKNCDFLDPGHLDILNNAGNAHYKFTDKGKYVVPYKGAGGQPAITWAWTGC